jgi:hypothetical protein
MTLNEYIKQNGSKQIEIQDDGTIKVLEDKGPWKPETGDRYFHIYGNGDFEEDYWFGGAADDYRAELATSSEPTQKSNALFTALKPGRNSWMLGDMRGWMVTSLKINTTPILSDVTRH